MRRNITYAEYRRRVFNTALLECLTRFNKMACDIKENDVKYNQLMESYAGTFYEDLLGLSTSAISQTKKKLSEAATFIQDCLSIAETIAAEKAEVAKEEKLEIPEDQVIELSDEDNAVIDKLFDEKEPDLQVDAVRDATVNALIAEDKKAQEIKDALSMASSQVSAGDNPKAMEETVNRLSSRGPTSLMNGIMNNLSAAAVRSMNENSDTTVSIGEAMSMNADDIKSRAVMMYSLFEASSVLGLKKYRPHEVKAIADRFYYGDL